MLAYDKLLVKELRSSLQWALWKFDTNAIFTWWGTEISTNAIPLACTCVAVTIINSRKIKGRIVVFPCLVAVFKLARLWISSKVKHYTFYFLGLALRGLLIWGGGVDAVSMCPPTRRIDKAWSLDLNEKPKTRQIRHGRCGSWCGLKTTKKNNHF